MMEHTPQMTAQSGLAFAVAVVDVGKGEKILGLFREEHALLGLCVHGARYGAHGNARPARHRRDGQGSRVLSRGEQTAQRILNRLGEELQTRYPGRGIAFAIPVSGIGRAGTAC